MKLKQLFAAAAVFATAPAVFAAGEGYDLTSLTGKVDFSTVAAAAVAIGVSVIGLYVAIKGVKIVIGMVKTA